MSKTAWSEYKLGPMTRCRLSIGAAVASLAFAAASVQPAVAQTAADAPAVAGSAPTVNAVWVEHEFMFTYFGFGTYYSCLGLESKIEYILKQVGARKDLRVQVSCIEGEGIQQIPTARIRVAVPAEATPELLAKLAEKQSKRELVSRVQGKDAGVDVATAQFPAEQRVVEFVGRRRDHIDDGDCELLNQLVPQVLEPLGVRMAKDSARLTCVPRQVQIGAVNIKLETLHQKPDAEAAPPGP